LIICGFSISAFAYLTKGTTQGFKQPAKLVAAVLCATRRVDTKRASLELEVVKSFLLIAIVEYLAPDHPLTANDPILLLDLNQEY
jgi:hypothetical protein